MLVNDQVAAIYWYKLYLSVIINTELKFNIDDGLFIKRHICQNSRLSVIGIVRIVNEARLVIIASVLFKSIN